MQHFVWWGGFIAAFYLFFNSPVRPALPVVCWLWVVSMPSMARERCTWMQERRSLVPAASRTRGLVSANSLW